MIQEPFANKVAIYPGSFDPITNGHVDLIKRGMRIFDEIVILIAHNPNKVYLFSIEERMEMIREIFSDTKEVRVDSYSGLLVDYLKISGANIILRGMRALSDFEYEFQMALTNMSLSPNMETIFLPSSLECMFLSSSMVREVAINGGNISGFVPADIVNDITEKLSRKGDKKNAD